MVVHVCLTARCRVEPGSSGVHCNVAPAGTASSCRGHTGSPHSHYTLHSLRCMILTRSWLKLTFPQYLFILYLKAGAGCAWPSHCTETAEPTGEVCRLKSWSETLGTVEPIGSAEKKSSEIYPNFSWYERHWSFVLLSNPKWTEVWNSWICWLLCHATLFSHLDLIWIYEAW